jgi:hypothetical protein
VSRPRLALPAAASLACLAVLAVLAVPAAGAAVTPSAAAPPGAIRKMGTVDVRALARRAGHRPYRPALRNSPAQQAFRAREEQRAQGGPSAFATPLSPPVVPGTDIVTSEVRRGFEGLNSRDSTVVNGFEVEPPDQGLCGGTFQETTFLFESVNLAIALFDTGTNQYTPQIDLNSFFGQAPAFDPATQRFGPFLSDPKCYFDPDTGHWFHTILEIDVDPQTGELGNHAATLIAVSRTADPLGDYTIYAIDATDPEHPHCPCFGDQPLLGADANGLYVSTAEYSIAENFSNGAQIYALDKRALGAGRVPALVQINTGTQFTATVQPATAPSGRYETRRGGTEYFMSGFDCLPPDCRINPGLGNRITVWALTNTSSLRLSRPAVSLSSTTITSEVYGQPVPQEQPQDPGPLARSLGQPAPRVEPNDVRMNQVVYARGRLWSGVNTIVTPGPRDGIAWFIVNPWIFTGSVHANIAHQGYIAARAGFVSFPAVGVDDTGRGVVAYSLMGPQVYPSAAWSRITFDGVTGPVRAARRGFRTEDGFTCYPDEDAPPDEQTLCRWGDYSASFALPNGEVWSATEFIGDDARTTFANWSTFVWPVTR